MNGAGEAKHRIEGEYILIYVPRATSKNMCMFTPKPDTVEKICTSSWRLTVVSCMYCRKSTKHHDTEYSASFAQFSTIWYGIRYHTSLLHKRTIGDGSSSNCLVNLCRYFSLSKHPWQEPRYWVAQCIPFCGGIQHGVSFSKQSRRDRRRTKWTGHG